MTAASLVVTLRELGVRLYLDEDRLRSRGPAGAVTPELAAAIRANRAPLVGLLADARRRAPDGQPWCHFGVGLACRNRPCLNPAHRAAPAADPLDEEF